MNKRILFTIALLGAYAIHVKAQDSITNAFDDLKRKGIVNTAKSEMSRPASAVEIKQLLEEQPAAGYFCFTEDRMHDICLNHTIPQRWLQLPADKRQQFTGECAPGEFYVWQIGVFTPYRQLFEKLRREGASKK